jgi:SAM-dependent methyltransferase
MNEFGKAFWNERWDSNDIAWDMGSASAPLKAFIDSIDSDENKYLKILIPGCGNAYEAEYLHTKGFRNVYIVDFAKKALAEFSKRVPGFPKDHLICGDFFELEEKGFDLILEQTFFCAIPPSLRHAYAKKMNELLLPGGKLVGLLFNDPKLDFESPPFGGDAETYRAIFNPYFALNKLEAAYNSIKPRAGRELFVNFQRKETTSSDA